MSDGYRNAMMDLEESCGRCPKHGNCFEDLRDCEYLHPPRESEESKLRKLSSDLARECDRLRQDLDLRCAQMAMVASELAGDSKLHWLNDRSDPRWTPTLQEAWAARQKHKEDAGNIVTLMRERDAASKRADDADARERKLVTEIKECVRLLSYCETDPMIDRQIRDSKAAITESEASNKGESK